MYANIFNYADFITNKTITMQTIPRVSYTAMHCSMMC